MKIVIAPDSFKESIDAAQAAQAIAEGVMEVCPSAQIDICPMADGGEGTVDAMIAATGGEFLTVDVFGPLGAPVRAKFGMLGDGQAILPGAIALAAADIAANGSTGGSGGSTAVIEMAAASGLCLVTSAMRDPMRASTYGTGQLIKAALDAGAKNIILGIGGSCTNDGGCGCMQALGVEFYDIDGELLRPGMGGADVADIARIDASNLDRRILGINFRVACDVTNPFTGPTGASYIFGPQKGATEEMVRQLDKNLIHLAGLLRTEIGVDIETVSGAGAAGGLGGGLMAFCEAKLENGGKLVADAVSLPRRLIDADLCITGEGKIDSQSRFGKVPVRVANIAGKAGVSTACIGGMVADDAPFDLFFTIRAMAHGDITPQYSMTHPAKLLKLRAKEIMTAFLSRKA
ncbi:MAG TPA: glycerate kinase [Phycisphaerae bacterium]|nr:glycerate kinase [Phycisphaerae bacterium]